MQDEYSIIGKIMAKYPVISEDEQQVLDEWKVKDGNQQILDAIVDDDTRIADLNRFLQIRSTKEANREKYYAAIAALTAKPKIHWWNKWQTYVAAASVIAIISLVTFVKIGGKKEIPTTQTPIVVKINDAPPGQFKAKLTLDDGTEVEVGNAKPGSIAKQGSTNVINKDGQLVYEQKGKENKIFYNRLSTSKGETYATLLSDGTKVWLNSQSSIRYPVAFNGDIRMVEVTGEAYFEVAPSIAKLSNGEMGKRPFIVSVPGMEIEVLGTHFNINSYGDEDAVKTTLVEGKVKVRSKSDNSTVILEPGDQAKLNNQDQKLEKLKDVDVNGAIAWRFGNFQFTNAGIPEVMRQLARWYDVEIVYSGKVPEREFVGKIPRKLTLSQVLDALKQVDVNFSIEGKKIIVSSK